MSARRTHRTANDYLKYLKGNLSREERYAFEKELEKDPFEREAMEGLEQHSIRDVEGDILHLHHRLRHRLRKRRRVTLYSIAATVAMLLIVGTVFIRVYDFNPREEERTGSEEVFPPSPSREAQPGPSEEVSHSLEPSSSKELTPSDELSPSEELTPSEETTPSKETTPSSEDVRDEVAKGAAEITYQEAEMKPADREPEPAVVETDEDQTLFEAEAYDFVAEEAAPLEMEAEQEQMETMPAGRARRMAREQSKSATQPAMWNESTITDITEVSGRILSGVDMNPLAGATVRLKDYQTAVAANPDGTFRLPVREGTEPTLVVSFIGMETTEFQVTEPKDVELVLQPDKKALNETVLLEVGAQLVAGGADRVVLLDAGLTESPGLRHAQPEGGIASFKNYIKNSLDRPEKATNEPLPVVVLSFVIKAEGSIGEITALHSTSDLYTEEATRLVREGPEWIPAFDGKQSVDEVIRLRILF